MEEKLATIEEIGDEIETLGWLEGVMELDNEGVSNLLHDVTLDLGVVNLIRPNDKVFLQGLNSVDLSIVLFTSHVYFAEGASPNDFEQREILHF